MTETTRTALIFGARNLGRAIIETLVEQGWNVAGAARSDETLANIAAAGAHALRSDITDQAAVRATVERPRRCSAPSTSPSTRRRRMGQRVRARSAAGPIADAGAGRVRQPGRRRLRARPSRSCRGAGGASGGARDRPATADPGDRRLVAAGAARAAGSGRRARSGCARSRRRRRSSCAARGIHVALLIVDAGIEPYAGGGRPGVDPAALADPRQVADAVVFLAEQGPRAATHELQVTPLAETWVP